MGKRETAKRLREEGWTYRQIAEELGCSHQYVAQILGKQSVDKFKVITNTCIYPNLRKWMNENMVSRSEFVRRMGYVPVAESKIYFAEVMRGERYPRKDYIDKMINVTSMPYEILFEVKSDGC